MKMSECIEILRRNTPDCFPYGWMPNCCQMLVCGMYLDGMSVSVDISEIKGKTDDEVKKLIKGRIIGVLRETITRIEPDYFTGPG